MKALTASFASDRVQITSGFVLRPKTDYPLFVAPSATFFMPKPFRTISDILQHNQPDVYQRLMQLRWASGGTVRVAGISYIDAHNAARLQPEPVAGRLAAAL